MIHPTQKAFTALPIGAIHLGGVPEEMIELTIQEQYLNSPYWSLLARQFSFPSDADGDWHGEFWGKMMRGACLTYQASPSLRLYQTLKNSVEELLSYQGKDGRLSTYPREKEFTGWDLWGRKYAMMGLLSFYEICKEETAKEKILSSLLAQANVIMAKIGKGKIPIVDTSRCYGALNSCSIIRPFLWLYSLTKEGQLLDFVHECVAEGLCKNEDVVANCLEPNLYPYQWAEKKIYETMSCVEGLVDLYRLEGNPKYLEAAKTFVTKVVDSDFTIIGCCGCHGEMFDHSVVTQTEEKDDIMEETCVTVTFMGLCYDLLLVTGEGHYADWMERAIQNALFGAVNSLHQTMAHSEGRIWDLEGYHLAQHSSFAFDSYSPLTYGKRGKVIGGFKLLQEEGTCGCCVANGGRGTALANRFAFLRSSDGYVLNFYSDATMDDASLGKTVHLEIQSDLAKENKVSILMQGQDQAFTLRLRRPSWAKQMKVTCQNEPVATFEENGYLCLHKTWHNDRVDIVFDVPLQMVKNGDKVAFLKGPFVLARDSRFEDNIRQPIVLPLSSSGEVIGEKEEQHPFPARLVYRLGEGKNSFLVCDYSSAGKNFDDPSSLLSVWLKTTL